jgi:hypothetical protein
LSTGAEDVRPASSWIIARFSIFLSEEENEKKMSKLFQRGKNSFFSFKILGPYAQHFFFFVTYDWAQ